MSSSINEIQGGQVSVHDQLSHLKHIKALSEKNSKVLSDANTQGTSKQLFDSAIKEIAALALYISNESDGLVEIEVAKLEKIDLITAGQRYHAMIEFEKSSETRGIFGTVDNSKIHVKYVFNKYKNSLPTANQNGSDKFTISVGDDSELGWKSSGPVLNNTRLAEHIIGKLLSQIVEKSEEDYRALLEGENKHYGVI